MLVSEHGPKDPSVGVLEGYVKLDVDGSSFRNSERVGFGGLIKDMEGAWLVGFSES